MDERSPLIVTFMKPILLMEVSKSGAYAVFESEFERQLPVHKHYREAFQAAQEKLGSMYSSFESFKSTRSYHHKKKKDR
jgi:hypothetical protein